MTSLQASPAVVDIDARIEDHLDEHLATVARLRSWLPTLSRWGAELADRLLRGRRLLVAGNGGSAAEAQHLSAELVGRFDGERRPFSAIALHAETSSVTAIGNDYGFDQVFARQVHAHGAAGDVLVLLTTSGRSRNLIEAARQARRNGVTSWALCGAAPNPLLDEVDEAIALGGPAAAVQEAHLLALHLVCRSFDHRVASREGGAL